MFLMKTVFSLVAAFMLLFILVDSASWVNVLISVVGIGLYMMIIWDYASKQGTKDIIAHETMVKTLENGGQVTKAERASGFRLWKGFAASAIATLPMVVLAIICGVRLVNGQPANNLQAILNFLNMVFTPIFGLIPMPNIGVNLSVIPSATTGLYATLHSQAITLPHILLLPELLFILWGSVSYILGKKFRQELQPNHQKKQRRFLF